MADADQSNLTMLTIDLLSVYVANNSVQHGDLSELIKSTHAALKAIDAPEEPAPAEPDHKPAVGIRKSLGSRTHILSMIDGKPYQTLKRHLSKHGLTPQEYRDRYSLPRDYPMVAPAYSESRRAIAERLGLGKKVASAETPAASKTADPTDKRPKAASTNKPASKVTAAKPKAQVAARPVTTAAKRGTGNKLKAAPTSQPASAPDNGAPRKRTAKGTTAAKAAS